MAVRHLLDFLVVVAVVVIAGHAELIVFSVEPLQSVTLKFIECLVSFSQKLINRFRFHVYRCLCVCTDYYHFQHRLIFEVLFVQIQLHKGIFAEQTCIENIRKKNKAAYRHMHLRTFFFLHIHSLSTELAVVVVVNCLLL